MNFHVIIPAHMGSKRFPGKAMHEINGKPMIGHVIKSALASHGVQKVFVATNDHSIAKYSNWCGAIPVMTSNEPVNGTERVAEAANTLNIPSDDIVVNVQADQPFFPMDLIPKLVNKLKTIFYYTYFVGTIYYRGAFKDDQNTVKILSDNDGVEALYFTRSLKMPGAYKHIGIYAYEMDILQRYAQERPGRLEQLERLEQLRFIEARYRMMVIESTVDVISINTPEDLKCLPL